MKIRDFAAVTGYAPRAARGAQWRVLSGSKTRHIIHAAFFKRFARFAHFFTAPNSTFVQKNRFEDALARMRGRAD